MVALDIPCAHCRTRPVQTVRTVWYLVGLVLLARWGRTRFVGCLSCTRTQALKLFLRTALVGWWSVPWGIATPLVLVQNLWSATRGPDRASLRSLLAEQGIDLEDVLLDASGRTRGQVSLERAVLAVLHRMIWADGHADPRELEVARSSAEALLGAHAEIEDLARPESLDADLRGLPDDSRMLLLRAAIRVAHADGRVDPSEIEALRGLGHELDIPRELIDTLVNGLGAAEPAREERRHMVVRAEQVLGLSSKTPLPELRGRYRSALLDAIADRQDTDAADARVRELTWAYEVIQNGDVLR